MYSIREIYIITSVLIVSLQTISLEPTDKSQVIHAHGSE